MPSGVDETTRDQTLPILLTVDEAATLLRTSRRGLYQLIQRRRVPGVTRLGRLILLRSRDLLDWLDQKRTPSLEL